VAKPIVKLTGTRQEFYWEEEKIYALVSRIHEHSDGRTTAEVLLKVNRPDIPSHIIHTQLNLLSARSKKQLIEEAEDRYPLPQGRWTNIVEQLCEGSLENYRKGKPAKEIWPVEGEETPEAPFLIKPLLYKDKPTIIFGEGSTGKSYLALTLGILTQLPYPDNPLGLLPQRANVLYLDYEADETEFRKRLTLLGNGLGVSPVPILYRECELPLVDDIDHLEQVVAEHEIGFIIIDSLGVAAGNANLNDAPTATAFYSALRRLKVTSLIITHTSKEERSKATPFGSVYFTNLARSVFEVRRHQEREANEIAIDLVHIKNNQGPLLEHQGFKIEFKPDRATVTRMEPRTIPEFLEKMSLKARITQLLKEEGKASSSDIAEMLDAPEETVRRTLNRYKNIFVKINRQWGLKHEE
jgi:DNA-directed RNA polymerase specialized sigma24 family protein